MRSLVQSTENKITKQNGKHKALSIPCMIKLKTKNKKKRKN